MKSVKFSSLLWFNILKFVMFMYYSTLRIIRRRTTRRPRLPTTTHLTLPTSTARRSTPPPASPATPALQPPPWAPGNVAPPYPCSAPSLPGKQWDRGYEASCGIVIRFQGLHKSLRGYNLTQFSLLYSEP